MQSHATTITRTILIRCAPGEDLLDCLQRATNEHGVQNGAFVSGAGSLSKYHFHVVSSTALPPDNAFIKGDGPFDIVAITGYVLGGRVHAHITFSDEKVAMGGHLESGCEVLTFALVTLIECDGPDMSTWDHVPGRQYTASGHRV
jgi:predicted DNA-binding protein with PD1-like motif